MNILKPQRLLLGDTIGVVAPSRHIFGNIERINKSIAYLRRCGFNVETGKHFKLRSYTSAGTPQERAEDINTMFADKRIKAIFCALGGDATNQILDLIDYRLIKENPKILIGYSDITFLLLAIYKKTGLITYHGPGLTSFSNLTETSKKFTLDLLCGKTDKNFNFFSGGRVYKDGIASGPLIGGNLFVINSLGNTSYSLDFEKSILFWEDIDEGLGSIEFQLYQLSLSGILSRIAGMVIGHIKSGNKEKSRSVKEIILELTKEYKYPIIKVDHFGHGVKRFLTYPIGVEAKIDTANKFFKIYSSAV